LYIKRRRQRGLPLPTLRVSSSSSDEGMVLDYVVTHMSDEAYREMMEMMGVVAC